MSERPEQQLAVCGHTVEIGTCTLPEGHELGHMDESQPDRYGTWGAPQWWDRSDESTPGAYSSIQPGDAAWRHEHGQCVTAHARKDVNWCVMCLRRERDELRRALSVATERERAEMQREHEFAVFHDGQATAHPLIIAALAIAEWNEEDDPFQHEWGRAYEKLISEAKKYRGEA